MRIPLRLLTIRLAAAHGELRPVLLPLLREGAFTPGVDNPPGWKHQGAKKWDYARGAKVWPFQVDVKTHAPGVQKALFPTMWTTEISFDPGKDYARDIGDDELAKRLGKLLGIYSVERLRTSPPRGAGLLTEMHVDLTPRQLDKRHDDIRKGLRTLSDETKQVAGFKWPVHATFEVFLQKF